MLKHSFKLLFILDTIIITQQKNIMHNIILYTIFFDKYIPNNIVISAIVIEKILFF